jgi:hypothetical protein
MTDTSGAVARRAVWCSAWRPSAMAAALLMSLMAAGIVVPAAGPTFYPDDPLAREPETQDASGVQPWENILSYDLLLNLFAQPGDVRDVRALNVNTADEVPDSNWFVNRILARPLSDAELFRGPSTGPPPAPGRMVVVRAKPAGISPGFVLRDAAGTTWFVQFDGRGYPEAATGAFMVANRIFHALGYYQVEAYLAELRPEDLDIGPRAEVETPSGAIRRIDRDDLQRVFDRAARQPNGAYRMLASRAVPGTVLGGFRYHGTRPDDPNDVVPHEHRRELRALHVFGGWTNLVDMKAGNTLDTLIELDGRSVVRHYLQDVGSTFGTGALGPREWDEGYEYLYESSATWKRLATFGFYIRPWQRIPYHEHRAIGRFEGDRFDPEAWRPRVPTTALRNARADDKFWAARRVMAFTDEMIRTVVKAGAYSDPEAERLLADVLIKRRDAIGRAYYTAISPLVGFALDDSGSLTFVNEAVQHGIIVPGDEPAYAAEWFRFDNATGATTPLGSSRAAASARLEAPAPLAGDFVKVSVRAVEAPYQRWQQPVDVYFRRARGDWQLVGVERLP